MAKMVWEPRTGQWIPDRLLNPSMSKEPVVTGREVYVAGQGYSVPESRAEAFSKETGGETTAVILSTGEKVDTLGSRITVDGQGYSVPRGKAEAFIREQEAGFQKQQAARQAISSVTRPNLFPKSAITVVPSSEGALKRQQEEFAMQKLASMNPLERGVHYAVAGLSSERVLGAALLSSDEQLRREVARTYVEKSQRGVVNNVLESPVAGTVLMGAGFGVGAGLVSRGVGVASKGLSVSAGAGNAARTLVGVGMAGVMTYDVASEFAEKEPGRSKETGVGKLITLPLFIASAGMGEKLVSTAPGWEATVAKQPPVKRDVLFVARTGETMAVEGAKVMPFEVSGKAGKAKFYGYGQIVEPVVPLVSEKYGRVERFGFAEVETKGKPYGTFTLGGKVGEKEVGRAYVYGVGRDVPREYVTVSRSLPGAGVKNAEFVLGVAKRPGETVRSLGVVYRKGDTPVFPKAPQRVSAGLLSRAKAIVSEPLSFTSFGKKKTPFEFKSMVPKTKGTNFKALEGRSASGGQSLQSIEMKERAKLISESVLSQVQESRPVSPLRSIPLLGGAMQETKIALNERLVSFRSFQTPQVMPRNLSPIVSSALLRDVFQHKMNTRASYLFRTSEAQKQITEDLIVETQPEVPALPPFFPGFRFYGGGGIGAPPAFSKSGESPSGGYSLDFPRAAKTKKKKQKKKRLLPDALSIFISRMQFGKATWLPGTKQEWTRFEATGGIGFSPTKEIRGWFG